MGDVRWHRLAAAPWAATGVGAAEAFLCRATQAAGVAACVVPPRWRFSTCWHAAAPDVERVQLDARGERQADEQLLVAIASQRLSTAPSQHGGKDLGVAGVQHAGSRTHLKLLHLERHPEAQDGHAMVRLTEEALS